MALAAAVLRRALDDQAPLEPALGALAEALRVVPVAVSPALESAFRACLMRDLSWSNPALPHAVPMLRCTPAHMAAQLIGACKSASLAVLEDVSHVPSPWNRRLTAVPPEAATEQDDHIEIALQLALQCLDQVLDSDHSGLCLRVRRFVVDSGGAHIPRTVSKLGTVTHAQGVGLLLRHGPRSLFDPSQVLKRLVESSAWRADPVLAGPVLEMLADTALQVHVSTLFTSPRARMDVTHVANEFADNRLVADSFERLVTCWSRDLKYPGSVSALMRELFAADKTARFASIVMMEVDDFDCKVAALTSVLEADARRLRPSVLKAFSHTSTAATSEALRPLLVKTVKVQAAHLSSGSGEAWASDLCVRCAWLLGEHAQVQWLSEANDALRMLVEAYWSPHPCYAAGLQALVKLALRFPSEQRKSTLEFFLSQRPTHIRDWNLARLQQTYASFRFEE